MHSFLPKTDSLLRGCAVTLRVACLLIVQVLALHTPAIPAQTSRDALFEKLCQAYRGQKTPGSEAKLAAFCRRHSNDPLAGLGYFLLGYQELENRKFQSSEAYLAKASQFAGPIQDYVLYHRASALFEMKRPEEARTVLDGFASRFPDSPWIEKAQTLFWKASLELKDAQGILRSLTRVSSLEDQPEALFYQAQAFELLEEISKAVPIYQRLHYQFPLYSNAVAVARRLSALGQQAGAGSAVPSEWVAARIEKLFSARSYRDALKDLEVLFQADSRAAENPQLRLWRGISQFGTGQYYEAIQTLKRLPAISPETAGQAWFTIAECYRKLDNYSQFKQAVEDMRSALPKSRWTEEALFSIGNYNLVRRNLEESMRFYRAIVEQFPAGSRIEDCHWRTAWFEYRQGQYERALELFIEHLSRFASSDHRTAALYWAGRSQQNLGRLAGAAQAYEAVAHRFPALYYGQLARKHLATLNGPMKVAFRTDPRLETAIREFGGASQDRLVDLSAVRKASLRDWPRAQVLAKVQLFEMAARELLRPQVYGTSQAVDFQAARLFYQEKNFYQTTVRLRRVFPNYLELPFAALPREIWEMFYPVNYESIIVREARKYRVDPFLIMALIRQESSFNPEAVSAANAHGLMQLLPSTARRLARAMKLRRPSISRLHDPELNVRLGMRYFSDLLSRFGGQEDKVLASYNAGEHRVDSWLSEGSYADSAEFVETIPFSETRNYVKIIFRNYFFYRKLYGSESEVRSLEPVVQ